MPDSAASVHGFIGLGHQGSPMAERMIGAGLRPWLWARRESVLNRYADNDARLASSAAEVGAHSDVIGLCLYDEAATDTVLFGEQGLAEAIRPGTVVAIHATVGPEYVIRAAQRLAERGVRVVDAPVSGGDQVALAGELLVMAGGAAEDLSACRPMFDTYSNHIISTGALGTAQSAKLLNNGLMTAITGLVFDAFSIAERWGISAEPLAEILGNGSAANPSVAIFQALGGAREFSVRAWPTLHKDIALLETATEETPAAASRLLECAASTIREMQTLRS